MARKTKCLLKKRLYSYSLFTAIDKGKLCPISWKQIRLECLNQEQMERLLSKRGKYSSDDEFEDNESELEVNPNQAFEEDYPPDLLDSFLQADSTKKEIVRAFADEYESNKQEYERTLTLAFCLNIAHADYCAREINQKTKATTLVISSKYCMIYENGEGRKISETEATNFLRQTLVQFVLM